MLDQRQGRWAGVVQMLCKCFVFAGMVLSYVALLWTIWPYILSDPQREQSESPIVKLIVLDLHNYTPGSI